MNYLSKCHFQGKRNYLDLISRYVDIHATLGNTQESKDTEIVSDMVPGYVTNHGILNSTQLKLLLQVRVVSDMHVMGVHDM